MPLKITGLYLYPIKSLAGIALQTAPLSERGFAHDRLWMLVNEDGTFITQREYSELVLFQIQLHDDGITVTHPKATASIRLYFEENTTVPMRHLSVQVWDDKVEAVLENEQVSDWFSAILKRKAHLARFPKQSHRPVEKHNDVLVNFSDSNQYMIIGQGSLDALNERLAQAVPMNRFRPNIVFEGGEAHIEDTWEQFQIGDSIFQSTKLCSRCKIVTIDQKNGTATKEPLTTLSQYRVIDKKVMFGVHLKLVSSLTKSIAVGMEVRV